MTQAEEPSPEQSSADPEKRGRRDLIVLGLFVLAGCVVVASDPDRLFDWLANHEAVRIDEFLTAIVILGTGFAIFSWRRWTDLTRQVAEYKRLQIKLTAMSREAALLSETDDLLQSCLTADEAFRIAIRHFETQFPTMSGAIFAIPEGKNVAELAGKWGKPAIGRDSFSIEDCWGVRRARVHISMVNDPELVCSHIGPSIPQYALCVPMMAHGEILGTLYLDNGLDQKQPVVNALTETQEQTVKTLSEHLSLAVANLNLRESLRIQSIRDPLTGLFNRRYMEESLERELRLALRKEAFLSVLMVDIDHFKSFNDGLGHEAGDAVLRELARLLQSQLRAEDIACRYGGDELLLVLPEADVEAAQNFAGRLQTAVRRTQIQHYGKVLEGLTLSIGIACYPQHAADVGALIGVADAALYKAKENGRNQFATAEGRPGGARHSDLRAK